MNCGFATRLQGRRLGSPCMRPRRTSEQQPACGARSQGLPSRAVFTHCQTLYPNMTIECRVLATEACRAYRGNNLRPIVAILRFDCQGNGDRCVYSSTRKGKLMTKRIALPVFSQLVPTRSVSTVFGAGEIQKPPTLPRQRRTWIAGIPTQTCIMPLPCPSSIAHLSANFPSGWYNALHRPAHRVA